MSFDQQPPNFKNLPARPSPNSPLGLKIENHRLKNEMQSLKEQALIDPVMNIYNRQYFDQQIENFGKSGDVTGATILIFDMDNFKTINDTQGHLVGDETLRLAADTLKKHIHSDDVLARFGGDEIAMIFPNLTDKDDIQKLIYRLYNGLAEKYLHVSFGFSTAIKDDPQSPIDLKTTLNEADQQLLEVKKYKDQ